MRPVQQSAVQPANVEDNRSAFWDEMMKIAVRGAEKPGSLTPEQVQKLCRIAVIGMARRQGLSTM